MNPKTQMQKPFFEHDCTSCVYLGSATVNEVQLDFYSHTYKKGSVGNTGTPTVLWRLSSEPGDYGSTPIDYVSPLSLYAMMALGLYTKHLGVNGASDSYIRGSFFKNSEIVLRIRDERPERPTHYS